MVLFAHQYQTCVPIPVGIPYNRLTIGVPKEILTNEKRVALVPKTVELLVRKGFNVNIETGLQYDMILNYYLLLIKYSYVTFSKLNNLIIHSCEQLFIFSTICFRNI